MSCNDDPYPKCGRSPSMQTTCAGSSLECGSFSTPPSRSPGPILGTPRHHSSTLNLPSSRLTWRWLALLARRLLYGNSSPHYLPMRGSPRWCRMGTTSMRIGSFGTRSTTRLITFSTSSELLQLFDRQDAPTCRDGSSD